MMDGGHVTVDVVVTLEDQFLFNELLMSLLGLRAAASGPGCGAGRRERPYHRGAWRDRTRDSSEVDR